MFDDLFTNSETIIEIQLYYLRDGNTVLAYNDEGTWILVFDGHGTIPCTDVDIYSFPTDMVPECVDELGNPITRE